MARTGGRYSAGDQITMADLFLVPQVRNAEERYRADLGPCPRVRAIYAACLETPEARATDPHELKRTDSPKLEPNRLPRCPRGPRAARARSIVLALGTRVRARGPCRAPRVAPARGA